MGMANLEQIASLPTADPKTPQQIEAIAAAAAVESTTTTTEAERVALEGTMPPVQKSLFGSAGLKVSSFSTKMSEGINAIGSRFNFVPPAALSVDGLKASALNSISNAGISLAKDAVNGIWSKFGASKDTSVKSILPSLSASDQAITNPLAKEKVSAAQSKAAKGSESKDDFYVSLTNTITKQVIQFDVMPDITESRSVEYEAVSPPQFPGAFQKYKGTSSVRWQVNVTLICRTTDEATRNLQYLNWIRGWEQPFYGDKILDTYLDSANGPMSVADRLGAPPPVLIFRGYRQAMIGPVPVVIASSNWNFPRDVDYIPARSPDGTREDIPFPTVIQVQMELIESFSTDQMNNFDLRAYTNGDFRRAYAKRKTSTSAAATSTTDAAVQPDAQYVSGAGVGSGAYDPRRVDQETADPRLVAAEKGRGSVNPPLAQARSELQKSDRPFLGRVGQMFQTKKGWNGPEPGHKDTFSGF